MREHDSSITTPAAPKPETEPPVLNGTSRRGVLNADAAVALAQRTDLARDRTGARQLGLRR
jgi:hypothetical protein